jgi:hypothetical protein
VQRIAAGAVAGRTVSAMARSERISRQTASRVKNSAEVQLLITKLVEQQGEEIQKLFVGALAVIHDSYSATRSAVFEGLAVDLGADHYARLTGVKCLTQLLTAGRQAIKPEPPAKKTFTLDALKQALAEADTAGVQ